VVRKELKLDETAIEERRTLEFLARCARPNLIQLLFWYQDGDKINYVFPRYPGSLQQVLEGKMDDQINPPQLVKFGPRLRHWLWQGMVDIIQALKFFHFPEQTILPANIIAAHFDMKPANILVDESGTLIITDFGQAQIRILNAAGGTAFPAQIGDANYQPPPIAQGTSPSTSSVSNPKWSRAYDVWSTACIMTEVIEYITRGGSKAYTVFRDLRFKEDKSSAAFWKVGPSGRYELKKIVQETLARFRLFQDRYLDLVVNLLDTMFSIDPLLRPTMSDCLTTISEDIPADEWPLKEDDEVSICGLGTNPQLRNMSVIFRICWKSDNG
jgi:serine/threonine protein kinase